MISKLFAKVASLGDSLNRGINSLSKYAKELEIKSYQDLMKSCIELLESNGIDTTNKTPEEIYQLAEVELEKIRSLSKRLSKK
ncbi:hypothetical protein MZA51_06440 [Haemophilus influenzae]|uniref:hypothetical protein n=1 Tax=Haemophilus influenzae TaxID=727 RepID=UPI0006669D0E|nr:hypothetical protein [Haemophilus influenzae]MCK9003560.1 hypothetical protein [Haemophilus influenzae]MCK9092286.1 hypothetical protein [Haemophilus influenzae]MCK9115568.1 hypothetical protein [Haemophilus influenzae]PRL95842.1 hypothetical protein BV012_01605 [Haemophilus influenzae]PRM13861.1 hypothetical protein BV003_00224 [Haemophilus influenzae]